MKKISFAIISLFISMIVICTNVYAEPIKIESEQDYFNAIAAINASEETEFVMRLDKDVVLEHYPTTANPETISGNKIVTFLGNDHTIKIKDTGEFGYHAILKVNGATLNLGNTEGDKISIKGGGPTVSSSESLIHVSNGTLNIYDGVEIGNQHSGNGGLSGAAIRVSVNGTVNMYGGRIHDNSNTSNCLGGAVMVDGNYATFNMYDGIFENNYTCGNYGAYGGAIFMEDYNDTGTMTVNIEGGTFKNNSSYFGGAIANIYGNLSIKNATFEGNTATCEVIGDEEPSGGAIVQFSGSQLTIENCTFINNSAYSAGAIYSYYSVVNLTDSILKNNTASMNGGAVKVSSYSTFYSKRNLYEGNTALNGGAIYNNKNLSSNNDTIKDNTAEIGGGIYGVGSYNIMLSTIYNNKATTKANDIYLSTTANNIYLSLASEYGTKATFNNKKVLIDNWYTDAADSRFIVSSPTSTLVYGDLDNKNLTSGTEYNLTAAGTTAFVTVKFKGEAVNIEDKEIELGSKLTGITNPTREGYIFGGWYTNSNFTAGTEFDFDTEINDNLTLYAKWEKETHKITINPNGGVYDNKTTNIVVEKENEDTYTLLEPTRDNYLFLGWTVEPSAVYNSETGKITVDGSDVTVTATWLEKKYTITINPNGGTYNDKDTNTTLSLTNNSEFKLETPTRENYRFVKWEVIPPEAYNSETGKVTVGNTEIQISAVWEYDYKITEGADQTYQGESLTVKTNGDIDKITSVKVNDVELDKSNYKIVRGSTILTLNKEYLDSLEAGTYKLTFIYEDGEVETTFTIDAKEVEEPTTSPEPTTPSADTPATGDNVIYFIVIFVVCLVAVIALIVFKKNNSKKDK